MAEVKLYGGLYCINLEFRFERQNTYTKPFIRIVKESDVKADYRTVTQLINVTCGVFVETEHEITSAS